MLFATTVISQLQHEGFLTRGKCTLNSQRCQVEEDWTEMQA